MLFVRITDPNAWLALGTLTLLEIARDRQYYFPLWSWLVPIAQKRGPWRRIGLMGAIVVRLALLVSIA